MSRPPSASILLLLLAALLPAPAASMGLALAPGDPVPEFQGVALDGSGAWVRWGGAKLNLVNLWATWCGPCRDEMPALERLSAAHARDGLRVVGVVVNDPADLPAVKAAAGAAGITYPVVLARAEGQSAFRGIAVIPTTFLVDDRGRVVRKYVGTSEKELDVLSRDVADYLAGRPLGPPFVPGPPEPASAPAAR